MNETILVDDRDPPWITSKLKSLIQEKNLFDKKYIKSNNQETFQAFFQIQERVRLAIEDSKKKYYEKLSKLFPDLLEKTYHEDRFVTDFQVKSEIFSSHFALF